jgi:hypothetical protein
MTSVSIFVSLLSLRRSQRSDSATIRIGRETGDAFPSARDVAHPLPAVIEIGLLSESVRDAFFRAAAELL